MKTLEHLGNYTEIDRYLIGKHRLPNERRNSFDIVTCCGNLTKGNFSKQIFREMLRALKPNGLMIWTIEKRYLDLESDQDMHYVQEIKDLTEDGQMSLFMEASPSEVNDLASSFGGQDIKVLAFRKGHSRS